MQHTAFWDIGEISTPEEILIGAEKKWWSAIKLYWRAVYKYNMIMYMVGWIRICRSRNVKDIYFLYIRSFQALHERQRIALKH